MTLPLVQQATPTHIHTWSRYFPGQEMRQLSGTTIIPILTTWHAANEAIYIPFRLPHPYPVRRVFWVNGSGTLANVDIAIASPGKGRFWELGSTAQVGASAVQYAALATEILLTPGVYYFCMSCSATNANAFYGISSGASGRWLTGIQRQSTAHPIPSPLAPGATPVGNLVYPLAGMSRLNTGF